MASSSYPDPGCLLLIVFCGDLYSKVPASLSLVDNSKVEYVVSMTRQNYDGEDFQRRGPDIVVFKNTVYLKTNMEPHHIEDHVLRTVKASSVSARPSRPEYEFSSMQTGRMDKNSAQPIATGMSQFFNMGTGQFPMHFEGSNMITASPAYFQPLPQSYSHQYIASPVAPPMTLPAAPAVVPPVAFVVAPRPSLPVPVVGPGSTFASVVITPGKSPMIAMPPRSQIRDTSSLLYGFDLWNAPAGTIASTNFMEPLKHNHEYLVLRGTVPAGPKKAVSKWPDEASQYVWELVELAIFQKNREISHIEYKPITEALHRRFAGTTFKGKLYVERGYNNVHSKVVKDPHYQEMLAWFSQ